MRQHITIKDIARIAGVSTSVTNNVKFVKVNNFVPSFCLIMMILLLTLKKRLAFSKTV